SRAQRHMVGLNHRSADEMCPVVVRATWARQECGWLSTAPLEMLGKRWLKPGAGQATRTTRPASGPQGGGATMAFTGVRRLRRAPLRRGSFPLGKAARPRRTPFPFAVYERFYQPIVFVKAWDTNTDCVSISGRPLATQLAS